MSPLYPTPSALQTVFSTRHPLIRPPKPHWQEPKTPIFSKFPAIAFSVNDNVKAKAQSLGEEASNEIKKASTSVQAKTGGIELYSLKYYEACIFGGLIACVSDGYAIVWYNVF